MSTSPQGLLISLLLLGGPLLAQRADNGFALPEGAASTTPRFLAPSQGQNPLGNDGNRVSNELPNQPPKRGSAPRSGSLAPKRPAATGPSQSLPAVDYHRLYQYSTITAFVNGLYKGTLPAAELKRHGDFGLGAPDQLDGELTVLDGRVYQTQATGTTREVPAGALAAFAEVSFFRPGTVIRPARSFSRPALLHYLDSLLSKQTGLYAIRITGQFAYVKTRAFPPLGDLPSQPLAALLDRQRFFEFRQTAGDLVGYRLPAFMEGLGPAGYHFHFLAARKDAGGHMLDFNATAVTIAIDELTSFLTVLPPTPEFDRFETAVAPPNSVQRVENGGKP